MTSFSSPAARSRGAGSRQPPLLLLYHRVADVLADPWNLAVTPEHFADQLDVLTARGRLVTVRDLVETLRAGRTPRGAIAITFDDGYSDNLHAAGPLLERHGAPATFFVTPDFSSGSAEAFWWDELEQMLLSAGELPPRIRIETAEGAATWALGSAAVWTAEDARRHRRWRASDGMAPTPRHATYLAIHRFLQALPTEPRRSVLSQLRAQIPGAGECPPRLTREGVGKLADSGLFEIGAHTMSHPRLSALARASQEAEVLESRRALQDAVGEEIVSFAYPFGGRHDFTAETVAAVRAAGFTGACAVTGTPIRRDLDPFVLPRFPVEDGDGEQFDRSLSRWLAA